MKRFLSLASTSFAIALAGLSTVASAQTFISTSGDWNAFHDGNGKDKVCYIASLPKSTQPQNVQRAKTYILISHRPAEKARNVFEFRAGYAFKDGVDVDLAIDGNKPFKLFTKDDAAWARDAATDQAIAEAMKKGNAVTIVGTSARGTKTTDTYSLSGISAALSAIDKECK
jgi:invasion protein IalB